MIAVWAPQRGAQACISREPLRVTMAISMNCFVRHLYFCFLMALSLVAQAQPQKVKAKHQRAVPIVSASNATDTAGLAEARLIEIYRMVAAGLARPALEKAQSLASDYPNFQLAQLLYGDLLAARVRPLRQAGDLPDALGQNGSAALEELRAESRMRIKALQERPPANALPSQFLAVSSRSRHAIAVDASRARLYLFENGTDGLKLVADFYVSVGKSGTEKKAEGDLRTPLGIYYITSHLDRSALSDFYGSGALPINYPNMLDVRRGKTGKGIWLHGTPPEQFSRPPKATDGCVVLANPDLLKIIRTVAAGSTPVVIAERLTWISTQAARAQGDSFQSTLNAWRSAKSTADLNGLLDFYAPDFNSYGRTLQQWAPTLKADMVKARGRELELKDVSVLQWTDAAETMVVTFGEVSQGSMSGSIRRQYWTRIGPHWKIFFEGVIG